MMFLSAHITKLSKNPTYAFVFKNPLQAPKPRFWSFRYSQTYLGMLQPEIEIPNICTNKLFTWTINRTTIAQVDMKSDDRRF